jgi:hypothetical protein
VLVCVVGVVVQGREGLGWGVCLLGWAGPGWEQEAQACMAAAVTVDLGLSLYSLTSQEKQDCSIQCWVTC